MESGGACKGVAEAVEDDMMLELEAAEALSGLARSSYSLSGEFERRRSQRVDTEAVAISSQSLQNTLKIVETTPTQAKNTSNLSKVPGTGTVRHMTEAEKETRRLHRVLANRESARQTIRRRQAMYLELTGKAAKLSMENTSLKQEREVAVMKYNYLKDKNGFLKAQVAKRKHAEAGHIHDSPESSRTEISSSAGATTPICLHNRASLFPFFWSFNSQCASSPDLTNASQFRITEPRPPFFVLPVPCLLPSLSPSGKLESHPSTKDQQHEPPLIHQCPTCSCASTLVHEDMAAGVCKSARLLPRSNDHGARFHFPPDYTKQSFLDKNHGGQFISSSTKPGNNDIAATEMRRKRRELLKQKKIHSPDMHKRLGGT